LHGEKHIKMRELSFWKFTLLMVQIAVLIVTISKGGDKVYQSLKKNPKMTLEQIFFISDKAGDLQRFNDKVTGKYVETVVLDTVGKFKRVDEVRKIVETHELGVMGVILRFISFLKALLLVALVGYTIYCIVVINLKSVFMRFAIFKLILVIMFIIHGVISLLGDVDPDSLLDFGGISRIKLGEYLYLVKFPVLVIMSLAVADILWFYRGGGGGAPKSTPMKAPAPNPTMSAPPPSADHGHDAHHH